VQLRELQSSMAQSIMAPLSVSSSASAGVAKLIRGGRGLSAHARLLVYKRSYWYRILDCFRDDFPGLRILLGENQFNRLARNYLATTPSQSFTLRDLGAGLERWLSSNPKYAGKRLAPAMDMVRLEWANIDAFDGAMLSVPDETAWLRVGPDSIFVLQPHLHLLRLSFAVDNLRIAANGGGSARAISHQRKLLLQMNQAKPKQRLVAVYRLDNSVYFRRMHSIELKILESLQRREPLQDAIGKAFQATALSAQKQAALVAKWFAIWTRLGWLSFITRDHQTGEHIC